MKEPRIINYPEITGYPEIKVTMRKDFYTNFDGQLKQLAEETGAIYFAHNIIKNYKETGHKVSTFCNHEIWHDVYWNDYCYDDPLEKISHQVTLKNDFSVISWAMDHYLSPCVQGRIKITGAKDGIMFAFKRPGNYLENLTIGWKKLDPEQLDMDYIQQLSARLKPIRDHHWAVHDKI